MFGYEKLPVFENVESRLVKRAIGIATRRAKLYMKPSVLLKEIVLFTLLVIFMPIVNTKVGGGSFLLILLGAPISIYIIKSEFNQYVVPLIPKALEDAKKFPTMAK